MRLEAMLKFVPLAALVAAAGCRTTNGVLADYQQNIAYGRYAEAAAEPAELAAKADDSQLLWQLLAASANDLADNSDKALALYDAAEDRMIYNDQASVFKQATDTAAAMMINDKFFKYDGGGQDRIFTCLYKAQIYAATGRKPAARTELNRAMQHQENWLWQRRKDLDAADERLRRETADYARSKSNADAAVDPAKSAGAVDGAFKSETFRQQIRSNYGFDIFTSGILNKLSPRDYQNPYATHFTGVFRWLNGDGGRNYLKDAASLRGDNPFVAQDNRECTAGARPANQVWVYVEDGLCPYRDEFRVDLPLFLIPYAGEYVKYAGLCLPRFRTRNNAAMYWSVNGVALKELANVDLLAKTEYDVFMRGAIAREITRTVVEVGAQVALGVAAEAARARAAHARHHRKDDRSAEYAAMALTLSQFGVAGYGALRRGADTRSWTALPKRVLLARIPRPADGTVTIVADGVPAAQVSLPPQGNAVVVLRKPTAYAKASVKVVNF